MYIAGLLGWRKQCERRNVSTGVASRFVTVSSGGYILLWKTVLALTTTTSVLEQYLRINLSPTATVNVMSRRVSSHHLGSRSKGPHWSVPCSGLVLGVVDGGVLLRAEESPGLR